MYKKNNGFKVGVIVFATIVVSLALSFFMINKNINLRSFFIKDGVLNVDRVFNKFFNRNYNELVSINKNLEAELEKYKIYENENLELKEEINKLKELSEVKSLLSDSSYVNGTVINRNFDSWNKKLLIDVGIRDGVSNGMAVVNNGSLIGIIDDASSKNSSVMLLSNKKFPVNISVKIKVGEDYIYGILNNYNEESKTFEVIGVVENIEIPAGSKVLTSGFSNYFPSGLFIGEVSSVVTDNFDLSKVVYVQNQFSDDITYVTVVGRGAE